MEALLRFFGTHVTQGIQKYPIAGQGNFLKGKNKRPSTFKDPLEPPPHWLNDPKVLVLIHTHTHTHTHHKQISLTAHNICSQMFIS